MLTELKSAGSDGDDETFPAEPGHIHASLDGGGDDEIAAVLREQEQLFSGAGNSTVEATQATRSPHVIAALAADAERISEIEKICLKGRHFNIEARAIEEGWTVRETMDAVIEVERAVFSF